MKKPTVYDVVVIGSGSAGFSAATTAKKQGARVCLIEKERLGGECPNWACVPTKALLKSAHTLRSAKGADEFGVTLSKLGHDFDRVMAHRKQVVDTITGGGEHGERYVEIAKRLEIDVVFGEAVFLDPHLVQVNDTLLKASSFVVATGTVDFIPPIKGLEDCAYLTFKEAVSLDRLPKSMAIIGAGPVGAEFATFFATLGTRVVLLQSTEIILNREDPDVAQVAHQELEKNGVEIVVAAQVTEVINARGGVYGVMATVAGEEKTFAVEKVLLATGKRSAIDGLGLQEAGVKLTDRGAIKTTTKQQTTVAHIFAAGDVDGGFQFTHTAHHEGVVAGYNAAIKALGLRKKQRQVDLRVVPRVTFVDPEVASVGMGVREVKDLYEEALVGRFDVGGLGRAVAERDRRGLVKLVAHPKTRVLLGGHIICSRAGELIHEVALCMKLGGSIDDLAGMIHAFPTYSEAIVSAASNTKLV